jgi:hypothetical protein
VIFNTSFDYGPKSASRFDLAMVMLHEIGHAFGLAHSDDPTSIMDESYRGDHGLSAGDVAAIQALYGARVVSVAINAYPIDPTQNPVGPTNPPTGGPPEGTSSPDDGFTVWLLPPASGPWWPGL